MAFDITQKKVRSPYEFISPVDRKEVTDFTANTAAQDWTTPRQYHRAYVALTTYTPGDANTVSVIALEASDVANFASNVDVLDSLIMVANAGAANNKPAATLAGSTPLVAGKQFSRLKVTLAANAAINADAIFEVA